MTDSAAVAMQWRDFGVVLAVFCASRLVYGILGVQFDATTFPGYVQFIDKELLETRLLESLWYYHANPPLLNLFAGIGVKLFGAGAPLFFAVCFHVLGIVLATTVYALTVYLSRSRSAAIVATALLVFSPAFVLYENWLMYTLPTATLLTGSAFLLYRSVQTGRTSWGVAFFGALAVLLLTRSLFHLAWLLLIVLLLALVSRGRVKQVLLAAALPVVLVAGWYGKNYFLFGTFSTSTWFGLGFSNISTLAVTRAELAPLVASGELSRFAVISRYRDIDKLFTLEPTPLTGVPVLDQVRKSTGQYNFNNSRVIVLNRYYTADGLKVARRFPASYVISLIISNRLFFSPPSMNLYFSDANRRAAKPMERVLNPMLYGVGAESGIIRQPHFGFTDKTLLEVNTSIPLFIAWWVLLGYGYVQARSGIIGGDEADKPRAVVFGFIVLSAAYLYTVGTVFELAENYRYRWLAEPLLFTVAASAIVCVARLLRQRFDKRVQ